MMKRKIVKYLKIGISMLFVLGALFLHFYAPKIIFEIRNPLVEVIRGTHIITTSPTFANLDSKGREIQFSSSDDTQLVAYEVYSRLDTTYGTMILLHGIRSNKEYYIQLSDRLSSEGINVIAMDLRAHGQSGGRNCTFGVSEKRDVSSLIDLIRQENPQQKIGIYGQSLGGAVALQTLGSDQRLAFGVVESTFSDFRSIINDYFKFHLGFNFKFLSDYLVNRAGSMADFDPDEASPIEYCSRIAQPVLMVHGTIDRKINIKYGKANFKKLQNKESEFLEIDNANHLNVREIGGEEYLVKIVEFMKENFE